MEASPKPKRSEQGYIRLNKKITDKTVIRLIAAEAAAKLMDEKEFCYHIIREWALGRISPPAKNKL